MKINLNTLVISGAILISIGVLSNTIIQYATVFSVAEALGKGNFEANLSYGPSMFSIAFGFVLVLIGLVSSFLAKESLKKNPEV